MSSIFNFRTRRGFSLIEVLVAVVILSVGLLALAALQINIVRSSADAKSRSTALSLAQEKLEQAREFRSRGSDQTNCPATTAATWPERYSCVGPSASPETMTVGGTTFSRTWTVGRYVFDEDAGSFASTAVGTADTALATGLRAGTEFKRIDVTVGWTDAEGDNRLVTVTDSVSASSPSESSRARAFQRAGVRKPEVLIYDPSGTPGVIPIAIGDGTDTAATNPRPTVAGRNTNERSTETSFDVLTYAGLNNNRAQVQSRVETKVVGCTCVNSPGSSYVYRPTYWSGNRYAAPEKITSTSPSQHKAIGNNDAPESQYCDICCRDHHDAGFNGPKFSPRRALHAHAISGGEYPEVCRVIRVDGIFRVAADAYNDYFNLLKTSNGGDDFTPDSSAASNYENFTLGYLGQRYLTSSSGYNSNLSSSAISALETSHSINDPSTIQIGQDAAKWMHARGLYPDFLEQDAIDVINEAKSNCDTSSSTLAACVLVHVPFTSINLTEIANWGPDTTRFKVSNANFKLSDPNNPVRGQATTSSTAATGDVTAVASITDSNSGLALWDPPLIYESVLGDNQAFHINGSGGGGPSGGTNGPFLISVTGYPFGTTTVGPTFSSPQITGGCGSTNPFLCAQSVLGGAVQLTMQQYNETRHPSVTRTLSCTKSNGTNPVSCSKTYNTNVCYDYNVDSATVGLGLTPATSKLVSGNGTGAETTTMNFGVINPNETVNLVMSLSGQTEMTATCTYNGNAANACNSPTISVASCP